MSQDLPRALRPKQAAEALGIGIATFWRWSKQRPDFPKFRRLSSRCTIVDADELIEWRDAQVGALGPTTCDDKESLTPHAAAVSTAVKIGVRL